MRLQKRKELGVLLMTDAHDKATQSLRIVGQPRARFDQRDGDFRAADRLDCRPAFGIGKVGIKASACPSSDDLRHLSVFGSEALAHLV
jgi:hypothetical protein